MKVLVVVDGHLVRTPDGNVWSSGIYNYDFFKRYLSVFESVRIAIRMSEVKTNKNYPNLCSGDGIEFFPIPEFKGPKEYIRNYFKVRKYAAKSFDECDCAIFRVPSTVGFQFMNLFKKKKKPYALEVVVDPWDFAAPGMLKTPLRPFIRMIWTYTLKKACLNANGVSYVTKYALQKRYPSYSIKNGKSDFKFDTSYSSVNIEDNYFQKPKVKEIPKKIKIIPVSNVIGNYVKGHKELIAAAKELLSRKYNIDVTFIGDGEYVNRFKKQCLDYNIIKNVHFIGKISDKIELRNKLLESDVFIFPSHAEGLPRVIIEAMAVGLPCISTNVNGIPELLDNKWLCSPGNINEIVEKFIELFSDKKILNIACKTNYNKSLEYAEKKLQNQREIFYTKLKKCVKK